MRRGYPGLTVLQAAAALLMETAPARAHDTWADGSPVPAWVTRACCGPSDVHHLTPDQVHRVPDGYRIEGYPKIIYDFQTSPSQDGDYWAFYGTTRDSEGQPLFTTVFCFFAPSWS